MRRLFLAAVFMAVLALVAWRMTPPPPLPASAPARQFSAARAFAVLADILREQVPHPVQSPANARVRDRIIARFHALGYTTTIQRAHSCNRRGRCADVENILATTGNERPAVLGVAHYDSVPAGPGASDDGVGFASMLESARAIRGERFRNPVGFLITDGEERGLLGAEAFVHDRRYSAGVHAIVNVENRGPTGPAFLFETSRHNYDLVRAAAHSLRRPFASSLFYTVYELLPNDTDVSVFKRAGTAAVNFAAIGDVRFYHTAKDDLGHVDAGTLQQSGENALAMLRALGNSDLNRRSGDAVFFDVLGLGIAYWPADWTPWIVVLSALILLIGIRDVRAGAVAVGIVAFVASLAMAAVIGFIAVKVTPHRVLHPFAVLLVMWIAGIAAACIATAAAARWASPREILAAYALVWLLIGGVLAWTLPGVSFLFVAPAAVAALFSHTRSTMLTATAWLVAACIVILPLALMVYTALGSLGLLADAVLLAIIATTCAPAAVKAG